MNHRLRIEMVLPALPRAGMEAVAATLAYGLRNRGHEVGFTCTDEAGLLGEELREKGFRVSVVPAPGLRPNVVPGRLGTWLRSLRPDAVHAHSGIWLKAAQAARYAGVPRIILTLHGIPVREQWFMRAYNRLAAARAHRVIAVSDNLLHYLAYRVGVPRHKVDLIYNGVCTSRFRKRPRDPGVRQSLGIPQDAVVIGNVARLHPVKNHDLLIDAFAMVRQRVPGAHLLLVGDGTRRQELEERLRRLGLDRCTHITGVVPDATRYLPEMDVFALSSHIEGLSISLLEAMASEVPVVATAVGGTPALLEHGTFGLLTPAGDTQAMAAALVDSLTQVEACRRRVAAALEIVRTRHSVDHMVESYERLYRTQSVPHSLRAQA